MSNPLDGKCDNFSLIDINEISSNILIIFISGYRKNNYWDITEYGKTINIIDKFKEKYLVKLLSLTDEGYKKPVSDICDIISKLVQVKCIIVANSYGCFYAQQLAFINGNIKGILLLDPTIKCERYLKELEIKTETDDPNINEKIKNFDKLPENLSFEFKLIINVHFCFNENLSTNVKYFLSICNKNINSSIEIINVPI